MDKQELQKFRTLLMREHERLVTELKGMAGPDPRVAGEWHTRFPKFEEVESGSHAAADEEADEVEEYEVRLASEGTLETRLLKVNRALEKIERGGYGVCARCRKPIPTARLAANPAAEFDMEHEENMRES